VPYLPTADANYQAGDAGDNCNEHDDRKNNSRREAKSRAASHRIECFHLNFLSLI
jgi:hypothetical protein